MEKGETLIVFKSADETRNSDTTYADDSSLTISVKAEETYHIRMWLAVYSYATADFKYRFNINGNTFLRAKGLITDTNTTTVADGGVASTSYNGYFFDEISLAAGQGYFAPGGGSGAIGPDATQTGIRADGIITPNSDGNITVQWAQNVSDAGDTTVKRGSFFEIERID